MPNQIQVTEPHPSIAKRLSNKFKSSDTVRLPSARGGAGNIRTYHRSELTSGLPEDTTTVVQPSISKKQAIVDSDAASQRSNSSAGSSINSSSSSSAKPRMMFRGIGGAGNAVSMDERRMFSFDEELEREEMMRRSREKSRVVMVGRGGAGNAVR